MIWVDGELAADDMVRLSALDESLHHGVGLFETLRTWNGRAVLLDQHLARMTRSAHALGISLDPARLPTRDSIAELLAATKPQSDVVLRITLSGGTRGCGARVWMRSSELPRDSGASAVRLGTVFVMDYDDPLARHKTLNYWRRRIAHERAVEAGYFDALAVTADGRIWETSRANLFGMKGDTLITPELEGPILPGIMRETVIGLARRRGLAVEYADIPWHDMDAAFLTNSVRGLVPILELELHRYPDAAQLTAGLKNSLFESLGSENTLQ